MRIKLQGEVANSNNGTAEYEARYIKLSSVNSGVNSAINKVYCAHFVTALSQAQNKSQIFGSFLPWCSILTVIAAATGESWETSIITTKR
jgi:isopentenyldiphosphate isomerase